MGTAESQETVSDYPVKISILHSFVVLILIHIKRAKVKEAILHSLQDTVLVEDVELCIP